VTGGALPPALRRILSCSSQSPRTGRGRARRPGRRRSAPLAGCVPSASSTPWRRTSCTGSGAGRPRTSDRCTHAASGSGSGSAGTRGGRRGPTPAGTGRGAGAPASVRYDISRGLPPRTRGGRGRGGVKNPSCLAAGAGRKGSSAAAGRGSHRRRGSGSGRGTAARPGGAWGGGGGAAPPAPPRQGGRDVPREITASGGGSGRVGGGGWGTGVAGPSAHDHCAWQPRRSGEAKRPPCHDKSRRDGRLSSTRE
jgi:hypothetical protein